ncbi:MAG: glycoside hydrolase family 127 protein [Phycisphaeraceae bacterium]|nr:glycoside hydrolase family 127 protein [Phycisphaeraceae bacterium]
MNAKPRRTLTPVSWRDVRLEDGYWKRKQDVNHKTTLPMVYRKCRDTGRLDAIKLQWKEGQPHKPHVFWDSDVAKWLEASAYSLATHPDRRLAATVREIVERYAASQGPDGYINSHFRTVRPRDRWTNLRADHELYTAGHLIEAAVALHEATGNRAFLEVIRGFADHIDQTFGREMGKIRGYPGHQEIEMALVKLYRATGENRYLKLARYFLDERGRKPLYFHLESNDPAWAGDGILSITHQCEKPVRKMKALTGHAVRALYMLSGMIDVAGETRDAKLWQVCRRHWANIVQRRMYITGGIGSTPAQERLTFDYDLPNETAYAETCAAIALVFAGWRMLRIEPDRQYADVMERALHNGVMSGVSLTGDRFFYNNPLRVHPLAASMEHRGENRAIIRRKWFGCSCCPTNIVRLLASIGGYFYSTVDDAVYVHLYAASTTNLTVADQRVTLRQITDYPWSDTVEMSVEPESAVTFKLALRVPGWCEGASMSINGQSIAMPRLQRGYAGIKRRWQPGDRVAMTLPMPVRRTSAHPACRANVGMVALERGPIVYCLEQVDNGADLHRLSLPREAVIHARHQPGLLGGVTVLTIPHGRRLTDKGWSGRLYDGCSPASQVRQTITAVPYAVWANRGKGEMTVWLREN